MTAPNPVPCHTNWSTCRHEHPGRDRTPPLPAIKILRHHGIYQTGGTRGYGALTNRGRDQGRDRAKFNGPAVDDHPRNGGLGDSAIRCVVYYKQCRTGRFTLTNAGNADRGGIQFASKQGGWKSVRKN